MRACRVENIAAYGGADLLETIELRVAMHAFAQLPRRDWTLEPQLRRTAKFGAPAPIFVAPVEQIKLQRRLELSLRNRAAHVRVFVEIQRLIEAEDCRPRCG